MNLSRLVAVQERAGWPKVATGVLRHALAAFGRPAKPRDRARRARSRVAEAVVGWERPRSFPPNNERRAIRCREQPEGFFDRLLVVWLRYRVSRVSRR